MPFSRILVATVAALLAAVTGCSSGGAAETASASSHRAGSFALSGVASMPENPATSSIGSISGTVTVFAAASLTEAFTTLGHDFEAAHPGVTVKFNFGASSALAEQILQGAPADVFASASPHNMQAVVRARAASMSFNFVKNTMEIAVPPDNPARVATVADLARSGVKLAVCQPQVPCGETAQTVFAKARVAVKPVTFEADVKLTLAKVELGEVDAGIVYVTDVNAAGTRVNGVSIPADINASTEYPIAALSRAPNSAAAQEFVAYVLSSTARRIFADAGFLAP